MICPDCSHDNIDGVDTCEACGQPLVEFDPSGSEMEQSIARHSVEVICQKSPVSVSSTSTVRDAVNTMVQNKIGCLLVMDGDALVGVFTERDVLNRVSENLEGLDRPVADFMTRSPEVVTREDSIAYALHAMHLGGYRHLPIVDGDGKPIGIVSVRDCLRFLCIRFAELRS